jgi:hypothetical protein
MATPSFTPAFIPPPRRLPIAGNPSAQDALDQPAGALPPGNQAANAGDPIRIFPNEAACLRLVAALALETNVEWMERLYLDMQELAAQEEGGIEAA